MEYESNSSHYATSRTALWCPVCGAREGQGCTYVEGLRFYGHNNYTGGTAFKPVQVPAAWEPLQARKDAPGAFRVSASNVRRPALNKQGWPSGGWVN